MHDESTILPTKHLTDDALFALAVPTAGVPEALPPHLMACHACSRALTEWKSAVRDLGDRDEEALAGRSPEEWTAAEDATLAALRTAGAPGRGRPEHLRWALPVAASLFVVLMLARGREIASTAPVVAEDEVAALSAEDRADDALLRDVERLAGDEEAEAGWDDLAPDPLEEPS